MLIGRSKELKQLGTYYTRDKSQILVLYGQKYVGKTSLIKEFMQDKPGFYYNAEPASEREQKYKMGLWLAGMGIKTLKYPEFSDVFSSFNTKHSQKKVIVFDEFQNIIKSCPGFLDELISFIHSEWNSQEFLVILSSSSVGFVENTLVSKIGEAAFELSGFIKIKELLFSDLREHFSLYTNEDCLITYSILGGLPGLWEMFDKKLSVKENIIKNIVSKSGPLHDVSKGLLGEELRETGVYNTIMLSLSEGRNKLNDLYEHTEFSRAKISVYIKNLMELEFVNKVFSVDSAGRDYAQKGIYDISCNIIDFYFTYIYKNSSFLEYETPEEFYSLRINPSLKNYVSKYYSGVCLEYLEKINAKNKLPVNVERFGKWVGKPGNIDIVGISESGKNILALCVYDKAMLTYEDYEWLLYCADKAKISPDFIYLFSGSRFDEKLSLEGKVKKNLKLFLLDNI